MFGAMIAATIATMAMTTSASSSVKPACGLPASDILRLAGAARLLVGTEREDIDFAVRSGDAVEIRITPRIDQRAVLLQVWPVPAIGGLRRSDERLQALLRRWIPADIQTIEFKRGDDVLNLNFRRLGTRGAEILDHLRRDDRGEQAENCQHDEQFEKREAGF